MAESLRRGLPSEVKGPRNSQPETYRVTSYLGLVRAGLLSLSFLLDGGPLAVVLGAHVELDRCSREDMT